MSPRSTSDPDLDLARAFVASHPPPGRLLQCGVTGAHLYGFPSADSDLDLKGIHLAPTRQVLGLEAKLPSHDLTAVFRAVECDFTSNEAALALRLLLTGNGNMLERILSPFQLTAGPEREELQSLARAAVSQAFAGHYTGFLRGCQREHERQPSAKTMLYCYRVALTGIHLLSTGELEADLTRLAPELGWPDLAELVALKRSGIEHGPLPPDLDQHHRARWPLLESRLAAALAHSPLPVSPPNAAACEAWLIQLRCADLAAGGKA